MVFRIARQESLVAACQAFDRWIGWARRYRIPSFVTLSRTITRHRPAIEATFEHGSSNGLVESIATGPPRPVTASYMCQESRRTGQRGAERHVFGSALSQTAGSAAL